MIKIFAPAANASSFRGNQLFRQGDRYGDASTLCRRQLHPDTVAMGQPANNEEAHLARHRHIDRRWRGQTLIDIDQLRPSQAAASWFLELGNGDKFFFDMGSGSMMNFAALGVSFVRANKLFLSHLHI